MKNFLYKHHLVLSIVLFLCVVIPSFFFLMRFIVGGIEQKTVDVRSIRIDQDINQGFLSSVADLREQKKIIEDRSDIFDVFLIEC